MKNGRGAITGRFCLMVPDSALMVRRRLLAPSRTMNEMHGEPWPSFETRRKYAAPQDEG